MMMKVPNIKSTIGRKAFSYIGPINWNKLSQDLKLIMKQDFQTPSQKRKLHELDNHPT